MTTNRAIVDALYRSANAGEAVVLATVVRITGSSYGGVGTRMVARVDGSTVGVVSGGCLETDLAEHAREVHAAKKARVVTYDTRADDETAWGLGLGCNGLIDVLLEPLDAVEAGAVGRLIEQGLVAGSRSVLATVIASSGDGADDVAAVGAHALFSGEVVETTGRWGDRSAVEFARECLTDALDAGRRGLVREHDGIAIAFEVVVPAVRLVVCGGGPDVAPLIRLARQLGWNLTVVDHRPVTSEHEARFPGAAVVECEAAAELGRCVSLTAHTAAVVMSHHYARDLEYARSLLASDVAYIGLLGPAARAERMRKEIAGTDAAMAQDARIFAPIGVDLGGDGPEAIALSIVAEVSAVLSDRPAGHLRDRNAPLHG